MKSRKKKERLELQKCLLKTPTGRPNGGGKKRENCKVHKSGERILGSCQFYGTSGTRGRENNKRGEGPKN